MTTSHDQLLIVQKYEKFINYFYPIAQNLPRQHGVSKEMFIRDMLSQVNLFIVAGKSNHIGRLYEADAGLTQLRYWLRFFEHKERKLITLRQHQVGSLMLAETGAILGSWISHRRDARKVQVGPL